MQKGRYKKTSVNIENNLYLMAISEGIELTAFVNNCLSLFFEVPPDHHQQLIKDKSEYSVLRLKEKYMRDISVVIKEHASQQTATETAKEKENELIKFGEYLKKTSAYPVFELCLKKHDFDDDTLRIVTSEINKMNGQRYDDIELWNRAIVWYQKYGEVSG